MIDLPKIWNKQFYFVKIRPMPTKFIERLFPKEEYVGYIWPTDNWVEVHCFKYKESGFHYKSHERDDWGKMKMSLSFNTCFVDRIKSFIISRKKVLFKNSDIIFCEPKKEDFDRWKEWHPTDNFLTFFEGDTLGWFIGETHGGELGVREIKGDTLSGIHDVTDTQIEKRKEYSKINKNKHVVY